MRAKCMDTITITSDSDYGKLVDAIRGVTVETDTEDILSEKNDAAQGIVQSVR